MHVKLINIADAKEFKTAVELSPEEEAALIAQYKADRTQEALEADYQDFDQQVAEGISAEQLLEELKSDSTEE